MPKILIEMKSLILLEYAEVYSDKDHIEFHLNQSCHCASNEYDYLVAARPDNKLFVALQKHTDLAGNIDSPDNVTCGCMQTTFTYIREATPEDIRNEIAIDLTAELPDDKVDKVQI